MKRLAGSRFWIMAAVVAVVVLAPAIFGNVVWGT